MRVRKIIGMILMALILVPTMLPWVLMSFVLVSGIFHTGLWSGSIMIGFIVSIGVYVVLNRFKGALLPITNFETMTLYELLGVKVFRAFTVPGDLMNEIIRRFEVEPNDLQPKAFLLELRKQIMFNEQIHWCGFLFCTFPLVAAFYLHWYGVFFYLVALNILFNLYPIFLQRYTRLRIAKIDKRRISTRLL